MLRKLSTPRAVLALLCLMYFLYFVNRVNISTVAPRFKADLNISNTHLGLRFWAFALPLGLGVGLVFPQRSARTSSHFSGGTGDTAFPHRCGPLRGCAVAAACAACTPRDDRGFLLRLDAVVVSELGTGVLLRELPPGSASVGHVLVGSLAGRSHW